jgi:signal transduction histidine kinase
MMRLPFVAIEVAGDAPQLVAEVGARNGVAVREFPLVHQGRPLGVLLAQPRSGESELSTRDGALLEQVADQASIAVAATLMSIDVLRSRERLIVAVEDERRRLRRDLHDGLGPSLTASAFRLDTARALLTSRAEEADELISAVRDDVATALNDIRRLVYDLRPPALDDLGLVGALRRQLDVPTPTGLRVSIDAPVAMPPMSAAVEVAAYRIVIEAVTNVRRHSTAASCHVIIRADDNLRIEVSDDGPSVETWTAGVGLSAMSERTAEVGGSIAAGPTPHGGRVEVSLPLSGSPR